jgi:hypothetical protein
MTDELFEKDGAWYSNQKQKCDSCGATVKYVVELALPNGSSVGKYCVQDHRDCFRNAAKKIIDDHPENEYTLFRSITYRPQKTGNRR